MRNAHAVALALQIVAKVQVAAISLLAMVNQNTACVRPAKTE